MRVKDILPATISGLDDELRGTFTYSDRLVVVPGTTPGDKIDVEVVSISRHHALAYGKISAVHERGDDFVTPACIRAAPLRGKCGGCQVMHLSASVQLDARKKIALDVLDALNVDHKVLQPLESSAPFGYRNRSNYVVARSKAGNWVLGSYAPGSREVASMAGCLIVHPEITDVEQAIQQILTEEVVPVGTAPDALRWVSLRSSKAGAVVVELIVRNEQASWISYAVKEIMAIKLDYGKVIGVAISVNDDTTNAIRVTDSKTLAGKTTLHDKVGKVTLEIPAGAFAQLNTEVASNAYLRAAELAQSPKVVWDLYGGLDGLGLNLAAAHNDVQVFGADSSQLSSEAANRSAKTLNLKATYITADLSAADHTEWTKNWPEPDTVIVNPPRRGLDETVLSVLESSTAKTLLYMSCGPQSFTRDARRLIDAGWKLDVMEAYDMLPQTGHVELLVRFTK